MKPLTGEKYCVAVMGLSGVGKTTLARKLPSDKWFHYSVDYRIWTHYLGDELSDYLKLLARTHPVLKDLLRTDAISVEPRVHFDNLRVTSVFMGMLGSLKEHGLNEREFARRMSLHADAEKLAVQDIVEFKQRAWKLYRYPHFIADLSGSLCEVVEPENSHDDTLSFLSKHCTLIYIRATDEHKLELIRRAQADPKPIYYRQDFLNETLPGLLKEYGVTKVTDLSPKVVGAHLYDKLISHRVERYEAIAKRHAVVLEMDEVKAIDGEQSLVELIRRKQG